MVIFRESMAFVALGLFIACVSLWADIASTLLHGVAQ
jgi:hypothetical protein